MRNTDIILDKLVVDIKSKLDVVERRLISGNICNMEDYKYNLGMRQTLASTRDYIETLKDEANNESRI